MKLTELIEADKVINRFMPGGIDRPKTYYDSWDNLHKVIDRIFSQYEKGDSAKVCELLRYALYHNNFEQVYGSVLFSIKHFTKTK